MISWSSLDMKMRILTASFAALSLASCGGGGSSSSTGNTTAAAPVAATAAPAGKNWVDTVVKVDDYGYRMGNPDAPIKIIEFGSRACPFCAMFDAEGAPKLKEGYIKTGKVSWEFRDYPIHGALDVAPILLGHCVEPEAFFPVLEQMMANQQTLLANERAVSAQVQAMGNPTPQQMATAYADGLGYTSFVKQRGLTEAKARACLADQKGYDTLTKATAKANSDYNVSSTPSFVLNGEMIPLSNTDAAWPQLEAAIKRAGG
jgi:protein-disulfide isomerase